MCGVTTRWQTSSSSSISRLPNSPVVTHSGVSTSVNPRTVARQTLLSTEFSRQEYWSGLLFPSLGDLSNPRIKPVPPASPALAGGFFIIWPTGEAQGFPNGELLFSRKKLIAKEDNSVTSLNLNRMIVLWKSLIACNLSWHWLGSFP